MSSKGKPIVFALEPHPLHASLIQQLHADIGLCSTRRFPDGESYVRIDSAVAQRSCIVLADLSRPDSKYLSLIFMLETLRELGASGVGLVAPYLSYMRQDRRFQTGEAITSRIFAADISRHVDWLVTVDPHLHRYHSLDEIYRVPSHVVQGAPALSKWLKNMQDLVLVGPDAESEQWVSGIAKRSGHPFVIGSKVRHGDRDVEVTLPSMNDFRSHTAMIIDDVISSGQTILQCIQALKDKGIDRIGCAAVHGIFADGVDSELMAAGLETLVTTNTIAHASNSVDVSPLLVGPINACLESCVSMGAH